MNKVLLLMALILSLVACKHKKSKENTEAYFPVLSFIKGQVKDVDSSLYNIKKIETIDSISDTAYIKREEFKTYAADFLNIPDISSDDLKDDYQESQMYDDQLKRIIITYTSKDTSNSIQREDVMLAPDDQGNSNVQTIIIDQVTPGKDSTIEKNMIWEAGKKFYIVTKLNKPGQPEKIKKLEVDWNDFPNRSSL